eukprot:CAMPEP_0194267464 /NCGR_PEP_ID=MMETSP0169-20130528/1947_1 /TAXON_ID=218684 /ORGANISM="Corethron pennatum, Strain L29A3" /LENGTH=684 /DNA_ID=CAMNT_0039008297 /DNA_START=150 /DNA_END=2201 /DNA_ORIENTATION=+
MDRTKVLSLLFSILLHVVASQNNLRPCRLYVIEYYCIPGEDGCPDTTLDCELEGHIYSVKGVSKEWIKEQVRTKKIISGESDLAVPSDQILVGRINVPESSVDELRITTGRGRRRLQSGPSKMGQSTVLVVRIIATDYEPNYSVSQLYDSFFGDGANVHSLKSQIEACSSGQTTIEPAFVPSVMDIKGVVEVEIGISLLGNSDTTTDYDLQVVRNAAIQQLDAAAIPYTDYNSVNFVIFGCKPNKCPWGAYAATNGWYAMYKGSYATFNTIAMNIYGKQMGLYASDRFLDGRIVPSGDHSCMMGKPLYGTNEQMCYNALKNTALGWFSSGAYNGDLSLSLSELPVMYEMIGVAEWDSGAEKLPWSLTIENYVVVSFNRAVGMTASTPEETADKVLVHDFEVQSGGESMLVAILDGGEKHEYFYAGTTTNIFVQVCQIGGDTSVIATRALVLVYDSSAGESVCPSESPSKMPSDLPSKMPSDKPSKMPSDKPSDQPSKIPSDQPSKMPSDQPSKMPSDQPSKIPSDQPSKMPSDHPSMIPSDQPSKIPSKIPSDQPSKIPSDQPSNIPSDQPSKLPSDQPSKLPSDQPSKMPSDQPSKMPSDQPSKMPSDQPSKMPSDQPSKIPSDQPSNMPSDQPSMVPSDQPSKMPSDKPSKMPSDQPSTMPSDQPSNHPSKIPSDKPSLLPS